MKKIIFLGSAMLLAASAFAQRTSTTLKKGWQFSKDSLAWQNVTVPHDWAIYGPFSRDNDLQCVAIEQNGETEESWKTGRTGGLPYIGKGFYTTSFEVADTAGRALSLIFDGAMSNARVKVNGREVAFWPYGYNSFYTDITDAVRPGSNLLEVSLENKEKQSRWYPGAGLYRNVHLVNTSKVHVPVWGTHVTTPYVGTDFANVLLKTEVSGLDKGEEVTLTTSIYNPEGQLVSSDTHSYKYYPGVAFTQNMRVKNPQLWSPQSPAMYKAVTRVIAGGRTADSYTTPFGIRSIELRDGVGFLLNGELIKFKGVCLHHDLGPLGAAVNKSAIRHQLEMLKDMGANAVRTSHNMPAPELVELCDSMGIMLMLEPFDDWGFRPKSENGYGSIFADWAEKDMVNMLKHYRNNPSVVMWSIGNEVPSQWGPDGIGELTMLQDIVHREDATRPVTCGMDQFDAVVNNGFGAALDIAGFNYKPQRYKEALEKLPQNLILGTETASTVSSRGAYKFPVKLGANVKYDDHLNSSYDTEYCWWSNIPELDFAADDDLPVNMGQFVWTGFDYLGEPTPYDDEGWPSHSSQFGIIDLASIPKDRYYLYRSQWNNNDNTLHILPHWTWPGREGEVTPVFVYTDSPAAELFINGRSQGIREKNDSSLMNRYRLMWNEVTYEPGELRVITYDKAGNPTGEAVMRTAGEAHHLVLSTDTQQLKAGTDDLAYITVQIADADGNILPEESREVHFAVGGAGKFKATANGDPTSLRSFQQPTMDLFSGAATAIVQAGDKPGQLTLTVTAEGLSPAAIIIPVK